MVDQFNRSPFFYGKKKKPLNGGSSSIASICLSDKHTHYFLNLIILSIFKSVGFIVLANVEPHFFRLRAYTHSNDFVGDPVE